VERGLFVQGVREACRCHDVNQLSNGLGAEEARSLSVNVIAYLYEPKHLFSKPEGHFSPSLKQLACVLPSSNLSISSWLMLRFFATTKFGARYMRSQKVC
jgi:hypothetical protein